MSTGDWVNVLVVAVQAVLLPAYMSLVVWLRHHDKQIAQQDVQIARIQTRMQMSPGAWDG